MNALLTACTQSNKNWIEIDYDIIVTNNPSNWQSRSSDAYQIAWTSSCKDEIPCTVCF